MPTYHKSILTFLLLFCSAITFAQDNQAMTLLKEGTALHDAKKYDEALAKYDAALKIEPANATILYEKAFTLSASGRVDNALLLLEKLATTQPTPRVYALLANIYDDQKLYDKSITYYNKGIALEPKDGNLRFNLSISYLLQKKYAEAEAAATEAIKLNPKHASSHRAYAIATYNQGKHVNSMMAWCNFLIIEPQTQRSIEALTYLKHMLYFNVKGNTMQMGGTDALTKEQQMGVALAVNASLMVSKNANGNNSAMVSPLDSLIGPLPMIFKLAGEKKDAGNTAFFNKYYADFFGALANTEYIPAFSRYITISTYRDQNIAWFKEHPDELKNLSTWINTTKRETE